MKFFRASDILMILSLANAFYFLPQAAPEHRVYYLIPGVCYLAFIVWKYIPKRKVIS